MKSIHYIMGAALAGSAWLSVGVTGVRAETSIEDLDQKVRILERKLELADEAAATRAKEAPTFTAGKEGFGLSSADKAFQLKLRGYVQTDGRFYQNDDEKPVADSLLLRRARLYLEGTVGKVGEFRVAPDFGGGNAVIQDAYAGLTVAPSLKLRVGKFTPPIGLERLQSSADTVLIELGPASSIAPNRDVGLQVYGDVAGGALSYAIGAFNGVADGSSGDSDIDDGKDLAARLFATPFKNADIPALAGLGFGVGASYGDQEGATNTTGLAGYRTAGQQSFFSYRTSATNSADVVLADGNRTRIAPQAYYYFGPLGVIGEYILSEQDVSKGDNSETLKNEAWQVTLSYVLTGEDAGYKSVTPRNPLGAGGSGAWELVAQFGELNVDDAAFPTYADPKKSAKSSSSWAAGVNWYATKYSRFALNYEVTSFDGGAASGDREDEQVVLARAQVSF